MITLVGRTLLALLVLAGLASLLAFGVLGVGRGEEGLSLDAVRRRVEGLPTMLFGPVQPGPESTNFDGAVLYAAGRTWLRGANPYDHDELKRSVEPEGILLGE